MQSLSKNKLKYIRSLHTSKYRQKYNNFIVEGHKSCIEFLRSGIFEVEELVATASWYDVNEKLCLRIEPGKIHIAGLDSMSTCSQFKSAPEVLLVLKQKLSKTSELISQSKPIILVDDVQDPGNLGTIIRIADWFGLFGVVRTFGSADFFNSKVVQSSMGSLNRIKIAEIEDPEILDWSRVVTLDMQGTSINDWVVPEGAIVVLGNEGNGVSKFFKLKAANRVSIPGFDDRVAESLNVAVATGIVAHYIFNSLVGKPNM